MQEQKVFLLIFTYFLITLGYIFSRGFFYPAGLFVLFSAFIILIIIQFKKSLKVKFPENFAAWILVILVALSLALYGGIYQSGPRWFMELSKALLLFSIPLCFFYVFSIAGKSLIVKYKFIILFFVAILIRFFLILSSPDPYIDVFSIQKIAPKALIAGQNPYSILYPKLYPNEVPDVFSYEPGVIYFDTPAVLLTGDPRYTMFFAEIFTALLLYLILKRGNVEYNKKSKVYELVPLIFLFNPRSLFIIEQAWIDPLVIFLITLFAYLFFVLKRKILGVIVLGIVLATKQYSLFLIPFLLRGGFLKIKDLFLSILVFALLVMPFLIWNYSDYLRDAVFYSLLYAPRHDSLSLNSLLWWITGHDIPSVLVFGFILIVLLFLLKVQKKFTSSMFLAAATFSLSIFLVYKLAFIHYFYFANSLLLLSFVFLIKENLVKNEK